MSRLKIDLFSSYFTEEELLDVVQEGELLILKLSHEAGDRLFADTKLRQELVAQAKSLGFTRLALDIST
jgi:hypothetical protein